MSDELVKRAYNACGHDGGPELVDLIIELTDRIEALTAERDAAYARGYADAETEISKSSLGQSNAFLHSQYASAADRVRELTAERDKYEAAWMTAEGKLADVEAERDRLREALGKLECKCSSNCDWLHDDVCPSWIARAALKGESYE